VSGLSQTVFLQTGKRIDEEVETAIATIEYTNMTRNQNPKLSC